MDSTVFTSYGTVPLWNTAKVEKFVATKPLLVVRHLALKTIVIMMIFNLDYIIVKLGTWMTEVLLMVRSIGLISFLFKMNFILMLQN